MDRRSRRERVDNVARTRCWGADNDKDLQVVCMLWLNFSDINYKTLRRTRQT